MKLLHISSYLECFLGKGNLESLQLSALLYENISKAFFDCTEIFNLRINTWYLILNACAPKSKRENFWRFPIKFLYTYLGTQGCSQDFLTGSAKYFPLFFCLLLHTWNRGIYSGGLKYAQNTRALKVYCRISINKNKENIYHINMMHVDCGAHRRPRRIIFEIIVWKFFNEFLICNGVPE